MPAAGFKKWREANPEKHRERVKAWKRENPVKAMIQAARGRARKTGIPFDLTQEDVPQNEFCPVLGIRLRYGMGGGKKMLPESATLDRVIPDLGYVKGNVAIISNLANCTKQGRSVEDFEALIAGYQKYVDYIRQHHRTA